MPRLERARPFRTPGRLSFAVFLTTVGGLLLAAGGVLLFLMVRARDTPEDSQRFGFWFLGVFGAYLLVRVWAYVLSRRIMCPLCHGPVLHERRCHKHRDAHRCGPLSFRLTTVCDILTRGMFTCMYCGTPFRMRK